MKKVLCFFFLAFLLVVSHQDRVQKRGGNKSRQGGPCSVTNKTLLNLQEKGKAIYGKLTATTACQTEMSKQNGDKKTKIREDYQKTCYTIGQSNMKVFVRAKTDELSDIPGSDECASLPEFQAVYLNQDENTNTYMILNTAVAPWFFTAQLGGCDVFVATDSTRLDRPIVMHSN